MQKSNSEGAELWNHITNAKEGPKRFRDTLYHTRVFPPDRIDGREMLRRLSLLEYNPWLIMKKIHFTSEDSFWAHEEMCPDWFWTNHGFASFDERYPEKTGKPMYSKVLDTDDSSIY